ncbi:arsenate reductase ArsC [Myxococcota bacterium]|nr:arsenate reductase ArsC [Myxococcota bacterium]MBU1383183.1 arsenate reductase ArsC [Myxococcota bacterium]MBU1497181.1 arsenate reductase ArsC [Myxococcota bacterium]
MSDKKKVLFLCTGNSCRSQMAEGFARHFHSEIMDVFSAGVESHGMNPFAVKVMAESAVDISSQRSKLIDEFEQITFDLVITVCDSAREACPFFPGPTVHHSFPDPPALAAEVKTAGGSEGDVFDCYRRVRDEISEFIQTKLINLIIVNSGQEAQP